MPGGQKMFTPSLSIVIRNGKVFPFIMNMVYTFVSRFAIFSIRTL